MPTLYSMVNETGNKNRILEMCKFRVRLVHWIDQGSIEHNSACSSEDSVSGDFYCQLELVTPAIPPHDQVIVLRDFNAVRGVDRQGYGDVVGNYGSGIVDDN